MNEKTPSVFEGTTTVATTSSAVARRRGPLEQVKILPYVALNDDPLRFEPVHFREEVQKVCYDEVNEHVFVVKNDFQIVRVLPVHENSFRIKFSGGNPLTSLRFNLCAKTLAIRRTTRSLSFVNFKAGGNQHEFTQACKTKSTAQLKEFYWTANDEIIYVTSHGLELYFINAEKRFAKLQKSISLSVSFAVYCKTCNLLVAASSLDGNVFYPFFISQGTITKVPKIQIELPIVTPNNQTPKFTNADVSVAELYGEPYIFVVKNHPKAFTGHKAEIVLYKVTKEKVFKAHILALSQHGRFLINIVDNVVIVHRQASQETFVFDILAPHQRIEQSFSASSSSKNIEQYVSFHRPLVPSCSIAPTIMKRAWQTTNQKDTFEMLPYSKNWISFFPDVLVDPKLGALWCVQLKLENFLPLFGDKINLIDFLLRRSKTRHLILTVLQDEVKPGKKIETTRIGELFDVITISLARTLNTNSPNLVVYEEVSQQNMMKNLFVPLSERKDVSSKVFVAVLLQFVRSLNANNLCVEHHIFELVIKSLVETGRFYQLHQFLQYHVIDDSKPVACLLLSLEKKYAPALQLALDMFKRLGNSQDEIFHVLLSENQYMSAIRFLRRLGKEVAIKTPGYHLLQTALDEKRMPEFLVAYKFFKDRMGQITDFENQEQFSKFTSYYDEMLTL
eukprot:m.104963 g.104963  ORF g.104963 m.104963 type:complete len:675 (-) comp9121_c4_seq1:4712-6736(-)